jgi:hypothetical protein
LQEISEVYATLTSGLQAEIKNKYATLDMLHKRQDVRAETDEEIIQRLVTVGGLNLLHSNHSASIQFNGIIFAEEGLYFV